MNRPAGISYYACDQNTSRRRRRSLICFSLVLFGEEVVEDRGLLVAVGAGLLRGEGDVEQGGLGPWPADELQPDGEAAPVVPDLHGDRRQAQEVAGYGVPDQRRCVFVALVDRRTSSTTATRPTTTARAESQDGQACKLRSELIHWKCMSSCLPPFM